eukprot:141271_1
MGNIPDWNPIIYDPQSLTLPFWIPDNNASRNDYAAYLTSFSRLDQGVGLVLNELKKRGFLDNTLIYFFSDNGEPFPSAKTNFYEQGQIEPMFISVPSMWQHNESKAIYSNQIATALDLVPTVLDWCNISYPKQKLNGITIALTGNSLLPVINNLINIQDKNVIYSDVAEYVYGSYMIHESTMFYPMRAIRDNEYRLIHNLEYNSAFHFATDIFFGDTTQSILNCTENHGNNCWYIKSMNDYYFRKEYELFDMINDPKQLNNLAYDNKYVNVLNKLSNQLQKWQNVTNDPWAQCDMKYHVCYQWVKASQRFE